MCVYACLPLCIHKSERKEMIAQYLPITEVSLFHHDRNSVLSTVLL